MIEHLELKNLPYVDGYPEADQKRIPWVRNGECLDGATTKYGNDGTLNGAPLGIQRNVERLEENTELTKDALNVVIDNVNNINEALEAGSDVSIIQQVSKNKENIEILQVHMQFAEDNIGDLYTDTEFLKEDLGVYDPATDGYYRPVRDDIVFLKKEIGQYPDQDINGQSKPGAEATGMKRRIINNSSAIVSHAIRIKTLEDNYTDSDVGSLSIKINELRSELGPRASSIGKPDVYTRLDSLDSATDVSKETIDEIKEAIGLGSGASINTRMNSAESRLSAIDDNLNTPITGLNPKVTSIESAIGTSSEASTINGRLYRLREDHNALASIVGNDSSSGLRGQVAWMSETIGTSVNPAPTSIQGRLTSVTTMASASASDIQDIQVEIGTNQTGLKGSVLTLTRQMNGTNPNGNTVEERGVVNSVKILETRTANVISDAPADGLMYARKDANWVVVPSADDITDIQDGLAAVNLDVSSLKTRMDTAETETAKIEPLSVLVSTNSADISDANSKIEVLETELESKIEPCPQDGQAYVRVNNDWVLLSTFLTP
ncbi:fibritin neck whiskers protein [Enterobacter phage vB_EclM_CIP9]|uniref:Fibritin neck whiskers protein n=1 Tax=Enterobacter phage vB_EclM_CIP9 TaxID=2696340 RepID=A0A6B9Y0Q5_9CAUD|nr:fibritin neck whisker [Enterobacter phage vB_EclM_CIP9]QHS01819.1 fibritin neck whiskers protein [Enterobacter phage vB_EclM_CIP9]